MLLLGSYTINILGQKFCSPWNLFRIADLHFVWFFQNLFTIRVSSTELKVYWPYTIILVYTIILISKTGNPTRLFQHHDYSRLESTGNGKKFRMDFGNGNLYILTTLYVRTLFSDIRACVLCILALVHSVYFHNKYCFHKLFKKYYGSPIVGSIVEKP